MRERRVSDEREREAEREDVMRGVRFRGVRHARRFVQFVCVLARWHVCLGRSCMVGARGSGVRESLL